MSALGNGFYTGSELDLSPLPLDALTEGIELDFLESYATRVFNLR
jgi:hypothetical protein